MRRVAKPAFLATLAVLAPVLLAAPAAAADTAAPAELVEFLGDLLAPETTHQRDTPVFEAPAVGAMPLVFGQTTLAEIAAATGATILTAGAPVPLHWICLLTPGETRLLLAADAQMGADLSLIALWAGAAPPEPAARAGCAETPGAMATGLPGLDAPAAEIAARFAIETALGPVANIVSEAPRSDGATLQHLQYRFVDGRVTGLGLSQVDL
jgi:hypothetical protein